MRLDDWYRMTERPEERELRRKLRRRKWLDALAAAVAVPVLAALVALMILMAGAATLEAEGWSARGTGRSAGAGLLGDTAEKGELG